MSHYEAHYCDQVGGGIQRVYVGSQNQRGHGIGSFLGGLFRRALPFLKSGAGAVGREALRAGLNVMSDMNRDVPFKQALKNRAMESGGNLRRSAASKIETLMKGAGYKTPGSERGRQLMLGHGVSPIKRAKRRASVKRVGDKRKTKKKPAKSKKKPAKPKRKPVKKKKKSCCKKRTVADIFA